MNRKVTATIMVLLISVGAIYAQTTGRLAGRVRDNDGNPVEYANVILLGTDPLLGAQTREDGTYILINIPVGSYDVQAQQIGFRPTTVTGQRINVNETATLNITMVRDAVEIEGLTFTAARELVRADGTSSSRSITQESIENIAVESVEGIIALQAGTSQVGGNLHIRGGRANEVVYTIDGMSVSDPVDGGSAMSIDRNAIADMTVMTGGFTAEFGNAQSGIVNIVTRDGTSEYSGSVEFISDHIFDDGSNRDEIKMTLGGPVLGPAFEKLRGRFTFFFNAAAQWHDSRYREYYIADPWDTFKGLRGRPEEYPVYDPYEGRDRFWIFDLGDRNYNSYNANLKFTYRHSPSQTFSFSARTDIAKNYPFSWSWRYALEHYAEVEEDMRQYMFTYDRMFNPQTNFNLKGSFFRKKVNQGPRGIDRRDFYRAEPGWEYDPDRWETGFEGVDFLIGGDGLIDRDYTDPDVAAAYINPDNWYYRVQGRENPLPITGFVSPGSFWSSFIDDETTTISIRGDLEYQYDMANNIKTGFEITRHNIIKDRWVNPHGYRANYNKYLEWLEKYGTIQDVIVDTTEAGGEDIIVYTLEDRLEALYRTAGRRDGYEATPYQGAFYLQDRLQFEGMIANIGVRLDFWYLGDDYIKMADGEREQAKWDEWESDEDIRKMRVMVSPRVVVSHPISERAVLHFAYNYQNQLPPMQYIFTSVDRNDAIELGGVVGNPNLEPQITVTYEVGLQRQLGEDYVIDLTGYFKNIYNYVSIRRVPWEHPEHGDIEYLQYYSEDYGSARGIDFTLQKMLSNFIAGSISYSLAWAQGNHSGLTVKDETTGNLREFALNWDQRHSADLNFEFRIGRDEEWYVPFTDFRFPLNDLSLNFVYSIASGTPYTPISEEGNQELDTNSRSKPTTQNANLRFTKNFRFGRRNNLRFWISINNLFNHENILSVHRRTGRHDWDGADLTESHRPDYVDPIILHNYLQGIQNPSMVGTGRRIVTGLTFQW